MLSLSRVHMQMSWLHFASTFPPRLSTHGPQESSHGSSIGSGQIHSSTHHLVCSIISHLWLILSLELLGLSESEIRRHLTLEEEKENLADTRVDSDDEFTETKFLLYGLDLEGHQYAHFIVFSDL